MRLDKNVDELVMMGKEGIRQVMAKLFHHNVEVHPDDMDTIIDACETLGMSDEEIDELIEKTAIIVKWVVYARDRGGDPHNDERARIIDEALEKCLEELGIKNGSFEAIELTETFLECFEESQG